VCVSPRLPVGFVPDRLALAGRARVGCHESEVIPVYWVDLVIVICMGVGFLHGILKGVIQEVFAVLALVVGLVAAQRVSAGAEAVTSQLSHPTAGRVMVFILTFIVVALVIGLIGRLLSGLAKAASLRMIDRVIGGVVGACLVGLIIGAILKVGSEFGMDESFLKSSVLAPQLMAAVSYLGSFFPRAKESVSAQIVAEGLKWL
jgi:membrane protein required for colicin V production